MKIIPIPAPTEVTDRSRFLCEQLEHGNVLTLTPTPFAPSQPDLEFLLKQSQRSSNVHKNIAYKPNLGRVTGDAASAEDAERLRDIMAAYSDGALGFLRSLFPRYADSWRVDYASFRPIEEEGRVLPLRHRNDLMHVDAFPTRPTNGGRILRVFTNLHPTRERVWATAAAFEHLADRYALDAGLADVTGPAATARRALCSAARMLGVRAPQRSPYDEFMLRFHHYLKANGAFQASGQAAVTAFPAGTTWICFTDQVAHAVLSGQYAVEQTCIVPLCAMLLPELAPVSVLERIAGRSLLSKCVERRSEESAFNARL